MKMKKLLSLCLALGMIFTFIATGCSKGNETDKNAPLETPASKQETGTKAEGKDEVAEDKVEEVDIFGKYDPPITINIPFVDANRVYPKGQDYKDNVWTRAFEEELGVKLNYVWEVKSNDYTTKLNMAIASSELPDIFTCDYDTYYRLAKGGQLADLSDIVETYLHPDMKKNISEDPFWEKVHRIDGKIYGIGKIQNVNTDMLHYRDDWAKRVGITEKPKTLQDVIDMAYKFAEGDPNGDGTKTVGLGVNSGLFGSPGQVNLLFNAFDAWPDIWIEKDGKLVYGGLDENNKEALALLQQLYKDGVIDKEFGLKGAWAELANDVSANKVGMLMAPEYLTDWEAVRNVSQNHPWEATWTSVQFPHKNGGAVKGKTAVRGGSIAVVRKDFEHPEALVKLLNLTYKNLIDPETMRGEFHSVFEDGNVVRTFFLNFLNDIQVWKGVNIVNAEQVTKAVNGEISPEELTDEQRNYYEDCMKYVNKEDFVGWNYYHIFYIPGGVKEVELSIINNKDYMPDAYFGPNTDTMNENWGNIKSKQVELFSKIIMGDSVDETFQEWVDYFNSQGGDKITEEVNQWYQENK